MEFTMAVMDLYMNEGNSPIPFLEVFRDILNADIANLEEANERASADLLRKQDEIVAEALRKLWELKR